MSYKDPDYEAKYRARNRSAIKNTHCGVSQRERRMKESINKEAAAKASHLRTGWSQKYEEGDGFEDIASELI